MREQLLKIYSLLYQTYGPQHWWPGETVFEVMAGAILTQNTAWRNVERSLDLLKKKGVLTPEGIHRLGREELAILIRSSGYFRIKADRLKAFIAFVFSEFGGRLSTMKRVPLMELRRKLLSIRGIGPETADSILLYGLKKDIFVVDAYTKRILSRHGIISERASYDEVQELFMKNLHHDEKVFNEYHALLVRLGKWVCKKVPNCGICPLKELKGPRGRGVKGSSEKSFKTVEPSNP